ncbi:MAG TPA: amino acid adenylation domain-containing protein, partial [Steroidobacteraceae bacterium]
QAYVRSRYEAPQGELEQILAGIWQELLHIEPIGRNDNFFSLGGHSLLIARMVERLQRVGWSAPLQRMFESPTLAELARMLTRAPARLEVAPSSLPARGARITPDMLSLVELDVGHIERIVQAVPGGTANIQDIYPLAPLQAGILFHHLLGQDRGDVYIQTTLLSVSSQDRLQKLIAALQAVIDRHDVLRTAILWEDLPRPVQVVYRQARLPVDVLTPDPRCDVEEWMKKRMQPQRLRLNLRQAPLLRLQVAAHPQGTQWYALLQWHHIICDHQSAAVLLEDTLSSLDERVQVHEPFPYREHVARILARTRDCNPEDLFQAKFGDVNEPTVPFGVRNVHVDSSQFAEAHETLEPGLTHRIRGQVRRLGFSAAILFHAAWGLVVGSTSGRNDIVFGTVLLGQHRESVGMRRSVGMFINTLPLRLRLQGVSAQELLEQTRRELIALLEHEHASLAVAQRCSGIPASDTLFTALMNYRHSPPDAAAWSDAHGIRQLAAQGGRANYPIVISVDDYGEAGFALTTQTDSRIDPHRLTAYLHTAIRSLVEALERQPHRSALTLRILPDAERLQLISGFNAARVSYPDEKLIHELFESQVRRQPEAVAVVYERKSLTYQELDARANQLAEYLKTRGVGPDRLVGICVERSLEMVVGLLGILKAGGAYLPLDPGYPSERLAHMLEDASPTILLIQERLRERLPPTRAEIVALDEDWVRFASEHPFANPAPSERGMRSDCLAYVIYTSGSSGTPKGVMIEHRNVTRLFAATDESFGFNEHDVWTLFHSFAFDFSVWELWGALLYGGRLVVVPALTARAPMEFHRLVCQEGVTILNQTPSAFTPFIDAQVRGTHPQHSLRLVIFGGEALTLNTLQRWIESNASDRPRLVNMYGITETTVHVTYSAISAREIESEQSCIVGKPIPDLRVYLLDPQGQPVPIGVAGEIHVGGAGVARGYLNRPQLTAQRFIPDPFNADSTA